MNISCEHLAGITINDNSREKTWTDNKRKSCVLPCSCAELRQKRNLANLHQKHVFSYPFIQEASGCSAPKKLQKSIPITVRQTGAIFCICCTRMPYFRFFRGAPGVSIWNIHNLKAQQRSHEVVWDTHLQPDQGHLSMSTSQITTSSFQWCINIHPLLYITEGNATGVLSNTPARNKWFKSRAEHLLLPICACVEYL